MNGLPADAAPALEAVAGALPAGFDALRREARAEGYRFVERLATDWQSGKTRFDRAGDRGLAELLLDRARASGRPITANAAAGSERFWEALGFRADPADGHTHMLSLRR